jgi:hypothetical protein
VSDIDTIVVDGIVVDGLKALDPEWPIREAALGYPDLYERIFSAPVITARERRQIESGFPR